MNPRLATLQWYVELGVDDAIADQPWDRFAAPAGHIAAPAATAGPSPAAASPVQPGPPPARVAVPPPSPLPAAAELASLGSLDALRERLDQFDGCALKATAMHTVFGTGPADADLMIIGEAPGEEEDRRGEPFIGASGQLLDRMLAAIGIARADVYITNTIYWRPPGNRTPTPAEIQSCLPFLQRQIALIQPRVLLLVGAAAAKTMLHRTEGIMRLRGRWFPYESGQETPAIPAMTTFHPAYLLRSPAQKREAWKDLQAIQNRLFPTNF